MPQRRPALARQARAALLWGVLTFAGLQLATAVALELWLGVARDPEFAAKLLRLQAQMAQAPTRPLVLFLGSSRALMGFRAARAEALLDGSAVFNFGIRGAGPMMQLVCLRRLLAAGIRPDRLFVEVIPPVLNQPAERPLEEEWLHGGRLTLREILRTARQHSQPQRLLRHWLKCRWAPWASHRRGLRASLLDDWTETMSSDDPLAGALDAHGWQPFFEHGITPRQRAVFLDIAQKQYRTAFGDFHLAMRSVDSLGQLLDLTRRHGIPTTLVLMPEGTPFQALYPETMRRELDRFLAAFSRAHGVGLLDARDWLEDDAFWDSHHQLPAGATRFTERFVREGIAPLLR